MIQVKEGCTTMQFNNSYEVISLIEQKKRNGIALRQFSKFMESINNPQLALRTIHIGGTNGKGSTTCVCANILQEAGYKVGMFTSPYLETHHDRIRINNAFIEDEVIVAYANEYYEKWVQYDLSMFEIDMFIATQYFLDNHVDFAIFEVGLGGEQDATNIISPLVSAITNIGMDHMEYLGDTYASIAKTKGGIIKENSMFITTEKKPECLSILQDICTQKHCRMRLCENPKDIQVDTNLHFTYKDLAITQPTLATYQATNTSLAIEIISFLQEENHIQLSPSTIVDAIAKTKWKGRFEVMQEEPLIIIDGAHNKEGMQALVDTACHIPHLRILFSALQDKPYQEMLAMLATISNDISVCEFPFYRAASLQELQVNPSIRAFKDLIEAITTLQKESTAPLLICGSLYFISEVRHYLKENANH